MLTELTGSRLRAKVLGWLFTHPDEEFFVRQLHVLLGEDSTNVSRELSRLSALGLVLGRRVGNQKRYKVNPGYPAYPELQGLVRKTFGLADFLRGALAPLRDSIDIAFIYGSQVGGKVSVASDVDVMIVGKASLKELVLALANAHGQIGREINPNVYPPAEFCRKLKQHHRFLTAVMKGPKIFLIGDERGLAGLAQERVARRSNAKRRGNPGTAGHRRP